MNTNKLLDTSNFEEVSLHVMSEERGNFIPIIMKCTDRIKDGIKKRLFGKQIWCFAICGMRHPHCMYENHGHLAKLDSVDCTNMRLC